MTNGGGDELLYYIHHISLNDGPVEKTLTINNNFRGLAKYVTEEYLDLKILQSGSRSCGV